MACNSLIQDGCSFSSIQKLGQLPQLGILPFVCEGLLSGSCQNRKNFLQQIFFLTDTNFFIEYAVFSVVVSLKTIYFVGEHEAFFTNTKFNFPSTGDAVAHLFWQLIFQGTPGCPNLQNESNGAFTPLAVENLDAFS